MKKFLSILLTLALLSSTLLFSCEDKDKSQDQEQEQPTNNEQDDELNKEKAILDNVIFLMNEDIDVQDPDDAINKLFGDFMIDGIVSSSEPSIISRVYKIDNFLVTEYKDGDVIYQTVKSSEIYTILSSSADSSLHYVDKEEYPYDRPLRIFDVFGIDISNLYSNEDSESDNEFPKVTHDTLTLSEDRKSVTFSDDFLNELAKSLVESLDIEKDEQEKFMSDMVVSGVFTVPDQTFTFSIEGNFESFGEFSTGMTMSFKDNKPYSSLISLSLTTEVEGTPLTLTQKNEIKDIVYDKDNKLISASASNSRIEECQIIVDGVAVDYSNSTVDNHSFTFENSVPKEFRVLIETNETMSFTGITKTSTASYELVLENSSLSFTESADGKVVDHITSDHVTLTTPDGVTIPKDVYSVIPK